MPCRRAKLLSADIRQGSQLQLIGCCKSETCTCGKGDRDLDSVRRRSQRARIDRPGTGEFCVASAYCWFRPGTANETALPSASATPEAEPGWPTAPSGTLGARARKNTTNNCDQRRFHQPRAKRKKRLDGFGRRTENMGGVTKILPQCCPWVGDGAARAVLGDVHCQAIL